MRKYVLENPNENARLEKQATLKHYALPDELQHFDFSGAERILDAGCGNGLLGRYLSEHYPNMTYTGADISRDRLEDARRLSPRNFQFELLNLHEPKDFQKLQGRFDVIINRYVMHHIRNHKIVLKNFFETLETGGRLCLIDIDGIFVNLGTAKPLLRESIEKIAQDFGGDLTIGRTLPALVAEVGFVDVKWAVEPMVFQGQDRRDEVEQFKERLQFARPVISEILGGELAYQRFAKEYLAELSDEKVAVFYSKFMVQARKP